LSHNSAGFLKCMKIKGSLMCNNPLFFGMQEKNNIYTCQPHNATFINGNNKQIIGM